MGAVNRPSWTDRSTAEPPFEIDFIDLFDILYRDFGMYNGRIYRHSKKCIYLEDKNGITKWCCDQDCEM